MTQSTDYGKKNVFQTEFSSPDFPMSCLCCFCFPRFCRVVFVTQCSQRETADIERRELRVLGRYHTLLHSALPRFIVLHKRTDHVVSLLALCTFTNIVLLVFTLLSLCSDLFSLFHRCCSHSGLSDHRLLD